MLAGAGYIKGVLAKLFIRVLAVALKLKERLQEENECCVILNAGAKAVSSEVLKGRTMLLPGFT